MSTATGQSPFNALFGRSSNIQVSEQLRELSVLAEKSATLLHSSEGNNITGIVALEREGDTIVRRIHECIDSAFILRFDKTDLEQLVSELDDIIDGIRKVANHKNIYATHLKTFRPEAKNLIKILEEMTVVVGGLIAMLGGKLSLEEVRPEVQKLSKLERQADEMLTTAEKALVEEFSKEGANTIAYLGWHKLYRIIERATDHANHCGTFVLSMARKEA